MGIFGNKDSLKKKTKVAEVKEPVLSKPLSEEVEEDEDEEESEEEDEPETECAFQYNYDSDDKNWDCDVCNDNVKCDKSKCPFWK